MVLAITLQNCRVDTFSGETAAKVILLSEPTREAQAKVIFRCPLSDSMKILFQYV